MKKVLLTSILMILTLILCTSMVSAAVTLQGTYGEDNPNFGGENQVASNPRADDEDDEDIYVNSVNLVLANDVATPMNITDVSYTYGYGFSQTDLNLSVTSQPTDITNTTSGTLVLNARVPEDLDAVESDDDEDDYLEAKAFHVADAVLTFTDLSTLTIPVYMQRENELVFKSERVYISINERSEDRLRNDDKTEEIKPGDEIAIRVEVENDFSSDSNVEIEDVLAKVLLDDTTDSGWDWDEVDEEENFGSITETKEGEETIEFTIDEEVDDYNDYVAYIYLSGEDENGAAHGEKIRFELEMDRDSYEFIVKKAELTSDMLSCSRTTTLTVRVDSIGKRGDDEVSIFVTSDELGIDLSKENIEMGGYGDSDDTYSKIFSITVPEEAAAGTYSLRTSVYYSGDEEDGALSDLKDDVIVVSECALTQPDADDNDQEDTADEDTEEETDDADIPDFDEDIPEYVLDEFGITDSVETSFVGGPLYLGILIVSIVVALGSIGTLIFLLVRK